MDSSTATVKTKGEKTAERKAKQHATLGAINLSDKRLRLFSDEETAAILGVSLVTLWRLRKSGQIRYSRVLNSLRYSEKDIADFLAGTGSSGVV